MFLFSIFRHVSSSDKIGKLYRNQGNLFAIDDETNDDQLESDKEANEPKVECVNLNVWLEKPDTLNKFKCFFLEKNAYKNKSEWIPG